MSFTPRLTKPEAGNKYYIRKADGGYSPAIKGKPNGKGSALIKAMQKWAGMDSKDCDGEIGPITIKAFQKKLSTTVDGTVSNPSQMVKALQIWANKQ